MGRPARSVTAPARSARASGVVRPARCVDVLSRPVGEDHLLVNLLLKQYHVLNEAAGCIWELADGTRTIDQITAAVASRYEKDASDVRPDVVDTIDGLVELQLLVLR